MIKHRDKRGRLMEIEAKVVFGDEQAVRPLLGENTAYAERNHLTMRHFNGRLVRKSLAFSKKVRMLAVSTAWEDLYYNFVRVHKSLRKPSRQAGKTQWIHKLRRWPPTWHRRHTRSGRSSALLYRNNT